MDKKLLVVGLLINVIVIITCQSSSSTTTVTTSTNNYNQLSSQNWFSSSYPLNILQIGRSETEMKCMLEFNQTLFGISLDIQAILKLSVDWVSSANWAGNNTLGTNSLYNSTIYYDSAKSVFYSTMPVSEWSKYINSEVILDPGINLKKINY